VNATVEGLRRQLREAEDQPDGRAKSAALERLVAEVDAAGADDLAVPVRQALLGAYTMGGEPQKQFAPFAWLLARYDREPERFTEEQRYQLLWSFKWVTSDVIDYPEVPLSRIEESLADMAGRYTAAGEGQAPVLRVRYELAAHLRGAAGAQEEFLAWVNAERTLLSDCQACEPSQRARHFAALGRHEDAVREAVPVLTGAQGCATQPMFMIDTVLGSLLVVGELERAASEHIRATRLLRTTPRADSRSGHLLVCARSGRLQRGLELLEEWLHWYTDAPSPLLRMDLGAAGARLLRGLIEAGQGDDVVVPKASAGSGPGLHPATVAQLHERMTAEARRIAQLFDRRNGTSAVSLRVERTLDAPPLPDLPVDAFRPARRPEAGSRAAGSRPGAPPVRTAPPVSPAGAAPATPDPADLAASGDLGALAAAYDAAVAAESDRMCGRVVDAWRSVRDRYVDDPAGADAIAVLEAGVAVQDLSDGDRPDPQPVRVGDRFRAAGAPGKGLLYEQSLLLGLARTGKLDPADAARQVQDRADGAGDVATAEERGVAQMWAVQGWRLAQSAGSEIPELTPIIDRGIAELEPAGEGLGHAGRRALCRLLRERASDLDPPERIGLLRQAIGVLPDGVRPQERAAARAELATLLADEDAEAAVRLWRDAAADASLAGADGLLARLFVGAARLETELERPEEAVRMLVRAVPLLDAEGDVAGGAFARFDLCRALLSANRPAEAAEVAENLLGDLTAGLAEQDLRPAPVVAAAADEIPDAESVAGGPDRDDLHLAGCTAFAAAEASIRLEQTDDARRLLRRAAGWHRRNRNPGAEAECWHVAGRITRDPAAAATEFGRAAALSDAAGDWSSMLVVLRRRAASLGETEGVAAALAALDDVEARIDVLAAVPAPADVPAQVWKHRRQHLELQRALTVEQRVGHLGDAGRAADAVPLVDGLPGRFAEVGDVFRSRSALGLRGLIRSDAGDVDGGIQDLREAAEGALAAGEAEQAWELGGRLAALLDRLGRPDEAEQAWERFCES
jgi:tetratricopeptide (TPR) repeat protein